jgi:hypothetical protein
MVSVFRKTAPIVKQLLPVTSTFCCMNFLSLVIFSSLPGKILKEMAK